MNFIERQDNLLSKDECVKVIRWVRDNKIVEGDNGKPFTGYDFCTLTPDDCSTPEVQPLFKSVLKLKDCYLKSFPEVKHLNKWELQYIRFKWWKPGNHYSQWHSEHCGECLCLKRIMSYLIYLSDNDCYTEFRRHRNVRTKAGRGIMFPAYYTHEHRGSLCKKGLDRYIASGYFGFV